MRACFGRVVRLRSQAAGQIGRLRGQTHGYPRSPLPSKRPENVRRTARMPHARVTPPGVPRASRLRMHKRKLLIGLATAGLLLAGFGAATMPASAEQRTLLVTLVGGAQVTVTVDVPPGTPTDQIQIPGVGGPTPLEDALVVVTTKMRRILDVRPQDRLAWVEPGVFNLDLATALAPTGFTYAPDPSSQQVSSIGGNVNTNAGGPHCLAYGVTSAHVTALDVVLPDGTRARIGSEGPAGAGYALRGIVAGSEGTLGVVTAACVRLTPIAPAVRTMLLDFARVEDCAATVSSIVARGVVPAALEMMDRGIV